MTEGYHNAHVSILAWLHRLNSVIGQRRLDDWTGSGLLAPIIGTYPDREPYTDTHQSRPLHQSTLHRPASVSAVGGWSVLYPHGYSVQCYPYSEDFHTGSTADVMSH